MSSLAVLGVAAVGGLLVLAFLGIAVVSNLRTDTQPEDLALDPPTFARFAALSFGPLGLVGGVAIAVAAVWGDLPLAVVGLGAASVTSQVVLIGGALGVGAYAVHHLLKRALEFAGFTYTELFEEMAPDDYPGVGFYALGYLVSTSTEEVVFRGLLMGAGAAALGVSPWYTLVPSAVLFGLAHTGRGSGSVVSTAAMGVLFGLVFLEFGLLAAAATHAVNNTTSAVTSAWRSDGTADPRDVTAESP